MCKKLVKKCSFNSGADAENLCHLAYRLFVYGYIEETFAVCRYTHDIPFPGKGVYRVWDFILYIWGLEVFLLYKQEKHEEANARAKEIDSIRAQPVDSIFNTPEKRREFIDKLYQRVVYPDDCFKRRLKKKKMNEMPMNIVFSTYQDGRVWRNRALSKFISTLGRITAGHK